MTTFSLAKDESVWSLTRYKLNILHISILTHSIEQTPPSETNRFAASQEIPRILSVAFQGKGPEVRGIESRWCNWNFY
jgi:hypothetical protein